MDKNTIRIIIKKIKKELMENDIIVNYIYLFGSQAAGTADNDSDIDVVVVSESFNNKDIFQRAKMIYPANFCRDYPLDVALLSINEWKKKKGIITHIIKETGVEYYPLA